LLTLPSEYLTLIATFAPVFSARVWRHVQILLIGAILAPGKRTVTSVLRVMGLSQTEHFQNFHRVLNRAVWSSRELSPLADAAGRPHRGDGAVVHLVKAADCGVCQPAVVGIVVDACPGGRAVPGDRSSDQRDTVRACLKSRATRYAPCRQQPHRDAVAHPVSGPARASFCSRATATTCLTLSHSTRVRLTILLLYPRAISSIILNARTAHF
jgi:hypothetical protein